MSPGQIYNVYSGIKLLGIVNEPTDEAAWRSAILHWPKGLLVDGTPKQSPTRIVLATNDYMRIVRNSSRRKAARRPLKATQRV